MSPLIHFLAGFFFSLIYYFVFNISLLEFFVLFLSTWFFIDLDLVFIFILKKKSVSPVKFFKWARDRRNFFLSLKKEERKEYVYPFRFLHSLELLTIILLFSLFNKIFQYVILGFIFHLVLDWIDLYNLKLDILHKVSWFYHLKKNKKHKNFWLS